MSLKRRIVAQFGKPEGLVGGMAGRIMAHRTSNKIRNYVTVELMNLEPDSRVLEIGCGTGLAITRCAEVITNGRIVGVDHSQVMINQAAKRLARARFGTRVELSRDTEGWKRNRSDFDRIFSVNAI